MTYNPAVSLLDLCMTNLSQPSLSNICGYGDDLPTTDGWTTIDGLPNCGDGTHHRCWRVIEVDDTQTIRLASGIGDRELLEVHIQIAVDCLGAVDMLRDCGRLGLIERRYYRNTFLQYQVHYDSQEFSPGILHAHPDLADEQIAFVTGDVFDGPVRLNTHQIVYCGVPTFTQQPPTPPWNPSIVDPLGRGGFVLHPDCTISPPPPPPNGGDVEREDDPLSVEAGDCAAPVLPVDPAPDGNGWADRDYILETDGTVSLTHPDPITGEATENLRHKAGHVVIHDSRVPSFDVHTQDARESAAALTVHGTLAAGQYVTVVATGDIVVSGDLVTPDNPSGETGLISLISQCGDVRLQPDLAGSTCLDSTLHPTHNITLQNVAVLTPNGSMWMPDWETPRCATPAGIPTFTFDGSVSSGYMGLHGEFDPSGDPLSGWSKVFTYPEDDPNTPNDESFWLRRPLWWPQMSGGEWLPTESLTVSLPPQPGLNVAWPTVTVTEGSTTTGSVRGETGCAAFSRRDHERDAITQQCSGAHADADIHTRRLAYRPDDLGGRVRISGCRHR